MPNKKEATKSKEEPKVKIFKSLEWVDKYLKRAKRRMPALIMPKSIKSFKLGVGKQLRHYGGCCLDDLTITLATHRDVWVKRNRKKVKSVVPISQIEILQTLAHELAHFEYLHHGYEHNWYAKTIFNTFGLKEKCPMCEGKGVVPVEYDISGI